MADEVDGGLGGGSRSQQERDEVGELHDAWAMREAKESSVSCGSYRG